MVKQHKLKINCSLVHNRQTCKLKEAMLQDWPLILSWPPSAQFPFFSLSWFSHDGSVLSRPSCPALSVDCRLPGCSVRGTFQARLLEWAAISSPRRSSRARNQMCISGVSCLGGGFCTTGPPGKPFSDSCCCCCSVAQSCLSLCDPMDCSMPGFPVLHPVWFLRGSHTIIHYNLHLLLICLCST